MNNETLLLGGRGMLAHSLKDRLMLAYFADPFETKAQRLIEYKGTKYVIDYDYEQTIKVLGIFNPTKKPAEGKYGFDAYGFDTIEDTKTIEYEITEEIIGLTKDFSNVQISIGLLRRSLFELYKEELIEKILERKKRT
ncbi:hypothetical protein HYZ41_01780 [archaeon]|nr:hypothetical protein [archaeon]